MDVWAESPLGICCLPLHAMQRTGIKYRLEASDGEYFFITIINNLFIKLKINICLIIS